MLDESPKRGPKLAFIETGCGFLFAENHGWQWAKSFCFIAFDPGRLLFLPKWLLPNFNFHTMHNLEARGVVFDPGKLGLDRVFLRKSRWSVYMLGVLQSLLLSNW